jgi:cytochrome c
MSDLNMNKAAAAVLLAGLIGMVAGKASELLYVGHFEHPGHHGEEHRGYKIDVVEEAAGGGTAPQGAADISALYASADVKAGGEYFTKKCAVCHTIENGGADKVGPHLWGVMGRAIASVGGFSYSSGMKKHAEEAKTWNFDTMNRFQWKPAKEVPGTLMSFGGTQKDRERANLIVYLNAQGGNLPLPPVTTPAAAPAPATEAPKAEAKEAPAKH